jgi:hypothetical protein
MVLSARIALHTRLRPADFKAVLDASEGFGAMCKMQGVFGAAAAAKGASRAHSGRHKQLLRPASKRLPCHARCSCQGRLAER